LNEQLDFKCSDVFLGTKSVTSASVDLWTLLIDICSGSLTWGEIFNDTSEVFSRIDRSL
jgi:altronate dehydratase